MADDKKNPKEASNIFHSIMKASVNQPKLKTDRFYKEVNDLQSLHKNEIAGELSDYFKLNTNGSDFWIDWVKEPDTKIKNAVEIAAYKYLV